MMIKVCAILVILVFNLGSLEACNGYTYKMNYVKNCNPNSVIKISPNGFNVILDNDCNVILSGCINITKPIKTAKGTYTIKKPPMPPLEGDLDFCEAAGSTDIEIIKQSFRTMGITKCPLSARNACAAPNNKISIAQFKNQLGMASGTTVIKLEAQHDTGKTCAEFSVTINRARKG